MADFVESEAEESEDEIINRKRKVQDYEDDEEEEDDDDEKLREEMKDLINDDEEEEEEDDKEDSDVEIGRKKKKRHEDYDDGLEDEDYDLLEENLGVKVQRKKKFKRLRRIEDEESDNEEVDDSGQRVDDREAIANELFEGDDMEGEDEQPRITADDTQMGEESEGESDESDFIVDDDGQPISKGKKKRHIKYNDAALQEAQEIFGVDFDYADFAEEGDEYEDEIDEDYEEEEEYDEGGEARPRPKKGARKRTSKKSIFDIFEPIELERSHLTDLDNDIRAADKPERFQLRGIPVTEAEDDEIEEEAEWIHKQAFTISTISIQEGEHSGTGHQPIAGRKNASAVGKIREALKFIRNQRFEVPFIAFYRKEYVEPDLNINDLWTVYKWDEKWCQLRTRKINLGKLFENMQQYQCDIVMADPDKPISEGLRTLEHSDILRLKKAQTVEEVQDCYAHFMLYYGQDVPAMKESIRKKEQKEKELNENEVPDDETESTKVKHVPHKDSYAICKDAGLDGLAKKFGLTPEQFGENLRDNYQRHEVDQYPVEPKEVASDYICKRFATDEDCLKAAKFMVATQISREPAVRKCVRQTFFERAKVTVRPTKKGLKEIDENHPCYSLKYLKNKPVKDLRGEQFLKLTMAERDGFLTMDVAMDKHGSNEGRHMYLEEIKQLYERDEFSKNVQEWNVERTQALETAFTEILYPTFQKELRLRLLNESKEGIVKACCRKLYNWLKVAPYQVDAQIEEEDDFDTREGVRVLAISYSPIRDVPAFCALIDGDGEVQEILRLPYLLNRRNSYREKDRIQKDKDLNSLKNLILAKRPHVVTVAAESREALMIIDDVKSIISDLIDNEGFPPISVELIDNELGILYMNSNKGESDFRDYPILLRQAISLARRLQDPLAEFAQLCSPDEDILCLKYHPLQNELNKDDLLYALYLEFVNRTNEVGVDFNKAIQFSHTANLVQFICGLGPRKGTFLIKTLRTSNHQLEARSQLVTQYNMGPTIFINCAGFIKIDTTSLVDSTETYLEVLDGSRVHPEAYEWARKMAVDALEYDDTSDDVNPAGALEEILENPEKLKDLDLDAFAEELERQGFGNKSITLYDIRAELNHKYKDLRTPYRPPNAEEAFNMLTKEIPETFYIGKLVLVYITGIARRKPKSDQLENANPIRHDESGLWQCPFCLKKNFPELSDVWSHFDDASCPGQAMGVRVRLDNSISGFIPTKMLSDKHVTNPEERVQIGMTTHARITKIDIERYAVDLTSRSSDLCDKNNEWRPPKDLYYDYDAEEKDHKTADDIAKKQNRQVYLKRVIVHPSFKNVGFKEAEKILDTMDQGDVIIRPSSKGKNHLTVTWKVADKINQHIDVREEGKENEFSLGHSLIIGDEAFEDLDEIIARHVQPMSGFARDLLSFRYYVVTDGGKKEDMEKMLFEEKRKAPNKIHYYLTASREYPGKFLLSYLPRNKVRHEYITVLPDGLRYRNRTFRSVNSVFRWFKEHFRDPVPGTPSMSVRTPMGQSSYIGNTPSINIAALDAQSIQRVAANLPNSVFNSLSQVTGHQTPGTFHGANAYAPGYSGGYNYQPYTPSQPVATPMAITPSYHAVPTPAHSQVPTPRYAQTPQQHTWVNPAARTPSRSTPKSTNAPAPTTQDWQRMAELWAKKSQETLVPGQITPRTPQMSRGSPSPMVMESTPADATPLIDEF